MYDRIRVEILTQGSEMNQHIPYSRENSQQKFECHRMRGKIFKKSLIKLFVNFRIILFRFLPKIHRFLTLEQRRKKLESAGRFYAGQRRSRYVQHQQRGEESDEQSKRAFRSPVGTGKQSHRADHQSGTGTLQTTLVL